MITFWRNTIIVKVLFNISSVKFTAQIIKLLKIIITQLFKELFLKYTFFINCILKSDNNIIRLYTLINTDITNYISSNKKVTHVLYNTLSIKSQPLVKLKEVKAFNNQSAK